MVPKSVVGAARADGGELRGLRELPPCLEKASVNKGVVSEVLSPAISAMGAGVGLTGAVLVRVPNRKLSMLRVLVLFTCK